MFQTRITAEYMNGSINGWPAPLLVRTTANTSDLAVIVNALLQPDGDAASARRLIIEADQEPAPLACTCAECDHPHSHCYTHGVYGFGESCPGCEAECR